MFRIQDTDVFLGGKFTYFDAKSTFDLSRLPIGIDQWEVDFKNVGLGFVFEYDSRDNIFTPNQGNHVLQTELEARYQITGRWAVVPFAGVGATADALNEFDSSDPRFAGGLGFRYLIARKLRLASGLDIARGPKD